MGVGVSVGLGKEVGVKVAVGGIGVGVGVKVGARVGGASLTIAGSVARNSGNGSHSGWVTRTATTMTPSTSATKPPKIRAWISRDAMLRDYRTG